MFRSQVYAIPKGQKLLDSPTLSILFDGGLDVNTVKPVFLGQKKCIYAKAGRTIYDSVVRHKSLYYDCHSCPDFHRDKLQQESRRRPCESRELVFNAADAPVSRYGTGFSSAA
jgi:hypothetical protein